MMEIEKKPEQLHLLRRLFAVSMTVYLLLAAVFYLLAGDQLRWRETADGVLEPIWYGLHYWPVTAGGAALLALYYCLTALRLRRGRSSRLLAAVCTLGKYRFLLKQLIARDFKVRYKRSALGVSWSILNPLLMMLVQYVVFSTLFKSSIPHFAAYLLTGVVMFNFFTESTGLTLLSIIGNASLLTKVDMPRFIYPLTRTLSSLVNLALSLIPLTLVCLLSGVRLHKAALLVLFFLFCLFVFTLGLGMLLSASMVFFRDTQFLWGVLSMMWIYLTPVFYPESILPERFRIILTLNPLYYFLKNARLCLIGGVSPEPYEYLRCLLIAFGMLAVGAWVFQRHQDQFALYL